MDAQIPSKTAVNGFRRLLPWSVLAAMAMAAMWSWTQQGIVHELLQPERSAEQRVESLKHFFSRQGFLAPVIYVVFVTAEVIVAPIPGILLYAPGGLLFGPIFGGVLAILGNTIGAGISCSLVRSVRSDRWDRFLNRNSMAPLQDSLNRRGGWMLFLLRLNPLTSSDMLSYAAGLTRIPVSHVMIATGCGMAPLCIGQSWLSDNLFHSFPQLIYPLLIITVIYVVAVIVIIQRLFRNPPPQKLP